MYLFSVTTYPNERNKQDNYEKFKEEQDWYFGALSKNGQILISSCNTVFEDDTYKTFLLAPEQDSLDKAEETPFVVEWFSKKGIKVWSVNEGEQRFESHTDRLTNAAH